MNHKKIDPYLALLDEEEKNFLESYEKDEWHSVENLEEEKAKARAAANNYLCKKAHVNICRYYSDFKKT